MSVGIPTPAADATAAAGSPEERGGRGARRRIVALWPFVAVAVVGLSALFAAVTRIHPGYDAFGWLVWGRQILHGNLNTDGAPSWKPLTFLFTLPYGVIGRAQLQLWVVTSVAGAVAGAVFAARIAYRLTGPSPGRRYAPVVAAALAGVGVLGINSYAHQVLIANSDPLVATLCLAAIDSHLSGRPRLAFSMIVLAGLGRPEAWPFASLYALWAWRTVASMRLLTVLGLLLIPALWFSVPALTSKSWLTPGDLALNSANVIHGNKIVGVLRRFDGLYTLPVQLAALLGVALAVARRQRPPAIIAGAAVLWIAIEAAFALHGWSAVPRYLFEPAAVTVALAGSGVGRLLADPPPRLGVVRWIGPVAVIALIVSLIPYGRAYVSTARADIDRQHRQSPVLGRLDDVISRDGGAARIRACGQPVTLIGFQSALAWELGKNVGEIGYRPGRAIQRGNPIVVFKPHRLGWQVQPFHLRPEQRSRCAGLKIDSTFG